MFQPDIVQLTPLLESARSISLLLPETPNYDQVAVATALRLSLQNTFHRPVTIICSSPMTVEFHRLVGVDSVSASTPASRSLVISFPGQTEFVDKVNYDLVHGQLQLVIIPKAGAPLIDPKRLQFSGSSDPADLLITIGVDSLSQLGEIYHSSKDYFASAKIISLTQNPLRQDFTPYQIFDQEASSLSEIAVRLLDSLRLQIDSDTASNLLSGLERSTRHFQEASVSVNTFEAATLLMRRGARRHDVLDPRDLPVGAVPEIPQAPAVIKTQTSPITGYGNDSQKSEELVAETRTESPAPSADWYEPKIFSGSMLQ